MDRTAASTAALVTGIDPAKPGAEHTAMTVDIHGVGSFIVVGAAGDKVTLEAPDGRTLLWQSQKMADDYRAMKRAEAAKSGPHPALAYNSRIEHAASLATAASTAAGGQGRAAMDAARVAVAATGVPLARIGMGYKPDTRGARECTRRRKQMHKVAAKLASQTEATQ